MLITKEYDDLKNERYYLAQMTCKITGRTVLAEGRTRANAMSAAHLQTKINQVKFYARNL